MTHNVVITSLVMYPSPRFVYPKSAAFQIPLSSITCVKTKKNVRGFHPMTSLGIGLDYDFYIMVWGDNEGWGKCLSTTATWSCVPDNWLAKAVAPLVTLTKTKQGLLLVLDATKETNHTKCVLMKMYVYKEGYDYRFPPDFCLDPPT